MGARGPRRAARATTDDDEKAPTTDLPDVPQGAAFNNNRTDPYFVEGLHHRARWLVPGMVMMGLDPPDVATVNLLVGLRVTNIYCYVDDYYSTPFRALQRAVRDRPQIRADVFQVDGNPLSGHVAEDLGKYATQLVNMVDQREVVFLCCTHQDTEQFIGLVSTMFLLARYGLSVAAAHEQMKEIFGGTSPLPDGHDWHGALEVVKAKAPTLHGYWGASTQQARRGDSPQRASFSQLGGREPSARAPPKSTPKKKQEGPKKSSTQSAGYEERSRRRAGGTREYHDHHGRSDEEHLAFLREENRELLDEQDGLRDKLMRVEGLVRLLKERAFE